MLDSHCDVIHMLSKQSDFSLNKVRSDLQFDIPSAKSAGLNAVFFALFIKQTEIQKAQSRFGELISNFQDVLFVNDDLMLALTPDDLLMRPFSNRIYVTLALENANPIDNMGNIQELHDIGIRYITLCHNKSNHICDSSTDNPIHNGLSEFGKNLVREMNKVGMMIDISHASDKTANDVLDITELPIIASHSNCYSVKNNSRNLNDQLIDRIARNNGVIQLTLLPKCLAPEADVNDFVDHIDHLSSRIGMKYVGFGSDFDGGGGIIDCSRINEIGKITTIMQEVYTPDEIEQFWGLNFLRVYQSNYKG